MPTFKKCIAYLVRGYLKTLPTAMRRMLGSLANYKLEATGLTIGTIPALASTELGKIKKVIGADLQSENRTRILRSTKQEQNSIHRDVRLCFIGGRGEPTLRHFSLSLSLSHSHTHTRARALYYATILICIHVYKKMDVISVRGLHEWSSLISPFLLSRPPPPPLKEQFVVILGRAG